MLCYYAISDSEKMKKCFHRMLQISIGIDEDRYYPTMVSDVCSSLDWAPFIGLINSAPNKLFDNL